MVWSSLLMSTTLGRLFLARRRNGERPAPTWFESMLAAGAPAEATVNVARFAIAAEGKRRTVNVQARVTRAPLRSNSINRPKYPDEPGTAGTPAAASERDHHCHRAVAEASGQEPGHLRGEAPAR